MDKPLGPYDLHEKIGRGGMGTVYLGIHRDTGQKAAVKVLSPAYSEDAGFRERFESEVKSMEQLNHPNIVQLYGYGEQDGTLFYGMELVEGDSLQQELAGGRRFHWREVAEFGIQICSALKHAHDHGIIHRDLKPANLLLTPDEQIKLTDFGIAKLFGNHQITVDGGVLGTADFMSPEQAEGTGATSKSDLYSLGGVLYSLLAGHPPFRGKSMGEVVHKVLYEEPRPVRLEAQETPEELSLLIDQLLKKAPAERIPTARAVSNRLKAIKHALTLREEASEGGILQMDTMVDQSPAGTAKLTEEEFADLETVYEKRDSGSGNGSSGSGRLPGNLAAVKPSVAVAPDPTPKTHYTVVDADNRHRRLIPEEPEESLARRVAGIVGILAMMCLLVYIVLQLRQPPGAEQLLERIEAGAQDGPEGLMRKEKLINDFLKRFPDRDEAAQVSEYREEIGLERLQRQLEVTSRLRNASRSLAPVEQALVDAIRKESLNPIAAARDLADIITLFATDEEATDREKKCIRLAERNLRRLNSQLSRNSDTYVNVLRERLDSAKRLSQSDPQQARNIVSAVVRLYADKPWADEIVQQARQMLQEL